MPVLGRVESNLRTRFLNPIDWILEKRHDCGEGFSVVALQCVLIEFLEAFYQGSLYTTSKKPREFEYNSSKQLFSDFRNNIKDVTLEELHALGKNASAYIKGQEKDFNI